MLLINSLSHFFIDAACAAALFGSGCTDMASLLILYNTLAFSTQCLVGLITDRLRGHTILTAVGCVLVALGFILPLPPMLTGAVAGLGNSLFHVCAGTVTLKASGGKAAPLGIFVAPGSIGLILGTLWPQVGLLFALSLLICAGAIVLVGRGVTAPVAPTAEPEGRGDILTVVVLLLAVAVRAVGGTAVSFPWKSTEVLSVITVAAVFVGKGAGGFVCDRLGAKNTALLSIPLAALLIAFGTSSILLSLAGQGLINLTMPVTLWLLYKELPDSPGFAFGLAASMLWPGTIAGQLLTLTGPALWACILGSFALALGAILFAVRKGGKPDVPDHS